jgi:hypothetical protein
MSKGSLHSWWIQTTANSESSGSFRRLESGGRKDPKNEDADRWPGIATQRVGETAPAQKNV